MSWVEVDRDDRHAIKLVTYRCSSCRRLAVARDGARLSECVCRGKR